MKPASPRCCCRGIPPPKVSLARPRYGASCRNCGPIRLLIACASRRERTQTNNASWACCTRGLAEATPGEQPQRDGGRYGSTSESGDFAALPTKRVCPPRGAATTTGLSEFWSPRLRAAMRCALLGDPFAPEPSPRRKRADQRQFRNDPGRTRTCNPRLRRLMSYPLGHGARC